MTESWRVPDLLKAARLYLAVRARELRLLDVSVATDTLRAVPGEPHVRYGTSTSFGLLVVAALNALEAIGASSPTELERQGALHRIALMAARLGMAYQKGLLEDFLIWADRELATARADRTDWNTLLQHVRDAPSHDPDPQQGE